MKYTADHSTLFIYIVSKHNQGQGENLEETIFTFLSGFDLSLFIFVIYMLNLNSPQPLTKYLECLYFISLRNPKDVIHGFYK